MRISEIVGGGLLILFGVFFAVAGPMAAEKEWRNPDSSIWPQVTPVPKPPPRWIFALGGLVFVVGGFYFLLVEAR